MYPTKLYKLEHVKITKMVPLHLVGLGRVIIKQSKDDYIQIKIISKKEIDLLKH